MCLTLNPTAAIWASDTMYTEVPSREALDATPANPGSLRTKLWDLPPSTQCPVVGVCLSMARLQILLKKAGLPIAGLSAYEQHQLAVGECRRHGRLAEIVQRELDRDFALTLQSLKAVRDEAALHERWREAAAGSHWAAVFWCVITHPRCTPSLLDVVLGEVHMMQHQVGMASRLDQQKAIRLRLEHDGLRQQLQAVQQRVQNQQAAAQQREQQLRQQLAEERQRAAQAQAQAQRAQDALQHWQQTHQGTVTLSELQAENQALRDTVALLEKALRRESVSDTAAMAPATAGSARTDHPPGRSTRPWHWMAAPDRARQPARCVVCVGGSTAQAPQYRDAAASSGVDLVHHDGGIEHKLTRLDHCLSQADVVICQTGCISHNAYWRVKEHCKRTGTPCAFITTPNAHTLRQVLQELASPDPRQCEPVVVP